MHVDPPSSDCFSTTSTHAPASAAARAAVRPPPPDPTTTTSKVELVMPRPLDGQGGSLYDAETSWQGPVDHCYEIEVTSRQPTQEAVDARHREDSDVSGRGSRRAEGPSPWRARRHRTAGGHRGLLGRQPHLAGRGHLLRAGAREPEGPGAARPRGRRW